MAKLRPVHGWTTLTVVQLSGSCLVIVCLILMLTFGFALLVAHGPITTHAIGLATLVVGLWLWRIVLRFTFNRLSGRSSKDG
jgi:hypothetical protein